MATPLGHALAGVAVAWTADLFPGVPSGRAAAATASFYWRAGGALTLMCAALAAAPDLDLLLPGLLFSGHRTWSHSIVAAALVTIVAAVVTGKVTGKLRSEKFEGRSQRARTALMCGAAYASHLLIDWLSVDDNPPRGLQLLWPFSPTWFISGLDLFLRTARERILSIESLRTNFVAMAWEAAILLPILVVLWRVRVKTLARFSAKLTGGHHPA